MAASQRIIDSHIHVWTPDTATYPRAPGTPAIPGPLEGPGTAEAMHDVMTKAGVQGSLIVQPVNYGQDYSYVLAAAEANPGFFKGMFVADPNAEAPVEALKKLVASRPLFWVGVRFNPYKWADEAMACQSGHELFKAAGELNLPVGFMPFKGLIRHVRDIEALMVASPATQVVIDHWGFFVQPATGFGEREVVEDSWTALLRLGKSYPQVHVKLSAMFRNSQDDPGFGSLEARLAELLEVFSSKRLLWGSDAPYFFDFGGYSDAVGAMPKWGLWEGLTEEQKDDMLHGTAERLFGAWSPWNSKGAEL